ncbi:MAG: PilZ domain-containing protein [Deltaproteobacteria bacterium]|nr:PilZ domain-containing protein [Deltaproteobacteria bacterium]
MGEERRQKTRVHFETHVIIKTEESEIRAEADSEDISMKGVFVRTPEKIPEGTPCDLEILLTGSSTRLALTIKGIVTRQEEAGLAIGFDSTDLDSYIHLKNIILYNASNHEEIENEMLSLK